jgi:CHASE2 domain-containing sensor protein/signal transduction histidine kinase
MSRLLPPLRQRLRWATAALPRVLPLAMVLALLAALLQVTGWTWRADRVVYDLGLSLWRRPPPPDIVIVAIDDASVAAIGRWPWPRAVHSTLLERLAEARPRAIGLDLVLSEPDPDPAQDLLLARMARLAHGAAPVVLPLSWQAAGPGEAPRPLLPVPALGEVVRLGAAEATVDADGVLRHAFLRTGLGERVYPHLALALLEAGGERLSAGLPVTRSAAQGEVSPPLDGWTRQDRFAIRYAGPPGHVQRVSYLDVLRGAVPAEQLRGRYVLVGMTAIGLGDTLATPVNRQQHAMPGVEVLANTLYTLRSGDSLRMVDAGLGAALAAGLTLLLVLGLDRLGSRWAWAAALAALPLALGTSLLALGGGVWWSPVPFAAAALLAYPLWSWRQLLRVVARLDDEIRDLVVEGGIGARGAAPVARPWSRLRDPMAARLARLHSAAETVRAARRFLADALAGLPTAMVVTDERGRVLLANAPAAQLFELEAAEQMQGLDLPGLLVEFLPTQAIDWDQLFLAKAPPPEAAQTIVAVEAHLERRGDFLLHFAPVELLERQRWVVTFADISAIRQAQRRREEALGFVSHDLRAPVHAIGLMARLQQQGRLALTPPELLAEVQRQADRALQLADEFVRVSRAESGPLQLALVAPADLLDEALADCQPQALDAAVRLTLEGPSSLPPWRLDRVLVRRALGNLLSNAIKHSPRGGGVTLAGRVEDDELILTVRDEGPGLSPAQCRQLERGSQGLPAGDVQGVGLGLLFVQRVAGRHGGRLLARPGSGQRGTLIELRLGGAVGPTAGA